MQFLHGIRASIVSEGLRPFALISTSVIGLIGTAPDADAAKFPLDTPIEINRQDVNETDLGLAGTLFDAITDVLRETTTRFVVIRVAEGVDADATMANIVGNPATRTGANAFLNAFGQTKIRPKILIATGWTHQRPSGNANPVVAAMRTVAEKLRAIIIADAPSTGNADALAVANEIGSERVYLFERLVFTADDPETPRPGSATSAGIIARTDQEFGPWYSPSNKEATSVVGVSPSVSFGNSDVDSDANILSEGRVATIVRTAAGFRLWGPYTTSPDTVNNQIGVRRQMGVILDALEENFLWAISLPISSQLLNDVQASVDAGLRLFQRQGATLIASVRLNPDLNTPDRFRAGEVYWDIEVEPPAALVTLNFRVHRNAGAYEVLLQDAA